MDICNPNVNNAEPVQYASRSLVSGNLDKATPGHCLATCTCLHTACFSHGKASACSNAALADDTASTSAQGCSCSTGVDATAQTHHTAGVASSAGSRTGNHVSSCRSKEEAARANLWHGGECHAPAISGRTGFARCLGRDSQQVVTMYAFDHLTSWLRSCWVRVLVLYFPSAHLHIAS